MISTPWRVSGRTPSGFGRDILQAAIARLDAPGPHHQDLDDHDRDHQPDHARQTVRRNQATYDEGRDHGRAASEHVADAVGAEPDLGWKQLGRIDAVEE